MTGGGVKVRDAADAPMPGALAVWQGLAASLGGALLASVLGVAKLEERSVADQKVIAELQGEVRTLVVQVQALSAELARQGERMAWLQQTASDRRDGERNSARMAAGPTCATGAVRLYCGHCGCRRFRSCPCAFRCAKVG